MGIDFQPQYPFGNLNYDFVFITDGIKCFLEFDGIQHFEYIEFFHGTEDYFKHRQYNDILKSKHGIENGHLIRIDYTCMDNIEGIIKEALALRWKVLFESNYVWMDR